MGFAAHTPGSCCGGRTARGPSVAEHLPLVSSCGLTMHLQRSLCFLALLFNTGVTLAGVTLSHIPVQHSESPAPGSPGSHPGF